MSNIKCSVWRMKDDAFPELLPESRNEINEAAQAMCEENAVLGYQQGLKRGITGTMIATGLIGIGVGCIVTACLQARNENKKFNK